MSDLRGCAPEGVPSGGHSVEGVRLLQDRQPAQEGGVRTRIDVLLSTVFLVLFVFLRRRLLVEELLVEEQGEVGLSSAEVGVFGGSGFYSFLEDVQEIDVETPFGKPSSAVLLGEVAGRRVAFIPRHGRKHELPPHRINYRANLWAMKELGANRVLGPCAAGSLRADVEPGHFVVCDQLVDRTWGREDTFYDGPVTTHISFADPYCPTMREVTAAAARSASLPVHERG